MTVDLISAASDGFFALLDGAIDADQAEVATNPTPIDPKDTTERQFVVIGEINSDDEGGKDEQLEKLSVQIAVIYRGTRRSLCHALMHQVRIACEHQVPDIPGVAFNKIRWVGATASPAAQDGITHAGIVEFEVFAEPA